MSYNYCGKGYCGPKKDACYDFCDCELNKSELCPLKDYLEKPFDTDSFMITDCFQDEFLIVDILKKIQWDSLYLTKI